MIRIIELNGRWHIITLRNNSIDWMAWDDATYDGPGCALGIGKTMDEAINDWKERS